MSSMDGLADGAPSSSSEILNRAPSSSSEILNRAPSSFSEILNDTSLSTGSKILPLPLIDPDIPITFSRSTPQPSGSASWHASSTQKEHREQYDEQSFVSQFPASWTPREEREGDKNRGNSLEFNCFSSGTGKSCAPMRTSSTNGGLASNCGQSVGSVLLSGPQPVGPQSVPPGTRSTSEQSLQQEAFIGWPRAVVVHSELRSETGFAGTVHEASAVTNMFLYFNICHYYDVLMYAVCCLCCCL